MNKSSLLILITLVISTISAKAQGILYSGEDVYKEKLDTNVYDARMLLFSNKILVLYKNKTRKKVPDKSVWGFENRQGEKFRYWKGEFYQIKDAGKLSIYMGPVHDRHEQYYFSKDISGDIFVLRKRNLHKMYPDNNCFLQRVDKYCKGIFHDSQDFDRRTKHFVVQNFFRDC